MKLLLSNQTPVWLSGRVPWFLKVTGLSVFLIIHHLVAIPQRKEDCGQRGGVFKIKSEKNSEGEGRPLRILLPTSRWNREGGRERDEGSPSPSLSLSHSQPSPVDSDLDTAPTLEKELFATICLVIGSAQFGVKGNLPGGL